MKKKLLGMIAGVLMVAGAMVPTGVFAEGEDNHDGLPYCTSSVKFLGMDPWYATLKCKEGGKEVSETNFNSEHLTGTVLGIIGTVVKDLLFLGGLLAVVLVMYGGFLMVTSQGNPAGVEKAKKTISGAIVGLIVALLAYAIATTVLKLTMNAGNSTGLVREATVAMVEREGM